MVTGWAGAVECIHKVLQRDSGSSICIHHMFYERRLDTYMAGSTIHTRIRFTFVYLHATVATSIARITGTIVTIPSIMILEGILKSHDGHMIIT